MAASPLLQTQADTNPIGVRTPREQLLEIGTALGDGGRYVTGNIVAIGGMATVYRARDMRLNLPCAIKALFIPGIDDPEEVEAFQREAQLLASVNFPGIVAVRDYFVESDFAFLVMDFIEGDNLYDRHRRTGREGEDTQDLPLSPAPEDLVVLYGIALAEALEHLHTRTPAIVYRDLKPHNVMRRSTDGRIILLDFGIARKLRARSRSCQTDDFGTPGYAAPEQYGSDGIIDARTDIHSLGVVLAELATGYNPRAKDAPRLIPEISTLSKGLTPSLARILQRCTERDPDERYQTATEVCDALKRWLEIPRDVRGKTDPAKTWSHYPRAAAAGQILSAAGLVYAADQMGNIFGLDARVGHVNVEQNFSTGGAADRYSVIASPEVLGQPTFLAVGASSAAAAWLTICDDNLTQLRRIGGHNSRLVAAWGMNSADGLYVAATEPKEIARIARDGSREWQYVWRCRMKSAPAALMASKFGAILLDDRENLALITPDGELAWQRRVTGASENKRLMRVGEDILLVGGAKGDAAVALVSGKTGRLRWRTDGIGRPLAMPLLTASGKGLIVTTRDAGLSVVRIRDGLVTERHADFPRPLVGATHVDPICDIVVLTEHGNGGRVLLYDINQRSILWSEPLGDVGAIAAPAVCGEVIVAQECGGAVHGWAWRTASA